MVSETKTTFKWKTKQQNNIRLILCIQNFEMESESLKNKVAILAACLGLSGAAASLIPPCFDLMVKYRDAQMTMMLSLKGKIHCITEVGVLCQVRL